MTEYTWTGWGRDGKCTPVPGESLGIFECLACERIITPESEPEADCPKWRKRLVFPAAGPMSEANRNNPLTVTYKLPTQGTQKGDL